MDPNSVQGQQDRQFTANTREITKMAGQFAGWAKGRIPTNRRRGFRKGWLLAAKPERSGGTNPQYAGTSTIELIVLTNGEVIWNGKPLGYFKLMFDPSIVRIQIDAYCREADVKWPY